MVAEHSSLRNSQGLARGRESCDPRVLGDYKTSADGWNQSHQRARIRVGFYPQDEGLGLMGLSAWWETTGERRPRARSPQEGRWNKHSKWPWLQNQDSEKAGCRDITKRNIKMAELSGLCDWKQKAKKERKLKVPGGLARTWSQSLSKEGKEYVCGEGKCPPGDGKCGAGAWERSERGGGGGARSGLFL